MPSCGHIVHCSSPGPRKRNIVICICCNFKIAMRLTSLCLCLLKLLWLKNNNNTVMLTMLNLWRACVLHFAEKEKKNMVTENLLENWHPHCCICLSLNGRRHPYLYVFYSLLFHFSSLITNSLFSPQDFFLFLFRFSSSLPSRQIFLFSNVFYLRTESEIPQNKEPKFEVLFEWSFNPLDCCSCYSTPEGGSREISLVSKLQKKKKKNATPRCSCHWAFRQKKKLGGITHCDIGGTKNIAAR